LLKEGTQENGRNVHNRESSHRYSEKTIPGSLIAQGLSGLNVAKIETFLQTTKYFNEKDAFSYLFH